MRHFPLYRRSAFAALLLITVTLAVTGNSAAAQNAVTFVPVITTLAGSGVSGNTGDTGPATSATFGNPVSVSYDAAGNIYVADKGKNVVRKITLASNIISTVAGTGTAGYNGDGVQATAAQLRGENAAWTDPAGNIYIADTTNNRIRKVNTAGVISTVAGNGTAGFAGDGAVANSSTTMISGPNAVVVDASGNIFIGDSGNQRIREISVVTGIITTIAGNGTGTNTGNNGLAVAATIAGPRYLFPDFAGNLYVVDRTNHVVREIVAASTIIKLVAGTGTLGSTGDGGLATSATLNTPNIASVDTAGNIYIIDQTPNVLRVVNGVSGVIYTLAGGNTTASSSGDGGLSTSATLNAPLGVGVSPGGNIDVSDSGNFTVRRLTLANTFPATNVGGGSPAQTNGIEAIQAVTVNSLALAAAPADFTVGAPTGCTLPVTLAADGVCPVPVSFTPTAAGLRTGQLQATDSNGNRYLLGLSGVGNAPAVAFSPGVIQTFAGNGTTGSTGDGGAATAARISAPAGIVLDSAGNAYIAGADNKVRKVATGTGVITTVAGTGTPGYTGDGATAVNATLNGPSGLALDPTGNLYIADAGNNAVRVVSAQTGNIATVPGTAGIFAAPRGVAVDAAGNTLYVADTGNHVIRKVSLPTGYVTVIAGNSGTAGFGGDNGLASSSTLRAPAGVSIDATGNIFIADTGNNVIRKITASSSVITTVAGTGTAAGTGDGGSATLAALNGPTRVVTDAAGDLYIADAGNNRIRFVSASSNNISTLAGTGAVATPYTGDNGLATAATLSNPSGIALDQYASLYIADTSDNRVAYVNARTSTLNFGSSNPNVTTPAQSMTVTNVGNLSLLFSKISISSGFAQTASGGSDCSATTTLAAGAGCQISISFTPTGSGTYNGTVTLTDNGLNTATSTQTFNVVGIGNSVSVPAKITATAGNNQTVTPFGTFPVALQVTVTDASGSGVAGVPVVFTAPATGASGTFANGTNTVTVTSGAGGVTSATAFTANGTRGSFVVTATTSNGTLSTSFTETIAGSPAPVVTLSFTPAGSPQTYGQTVTLRATLTPATLGGNNVSGTVAFYDNNGTTAIGSGSVSGGVATFAYIPAAGTHSYSAVYSGDTNFSSSSSTVPASLTVNPLGITAAANSITIAYGTAPLPALTGSLTGVLAADQANVTPTFTGVTGSGSTTPINSTTAVGVYPVITTLAGTAAPNYSVTSTSGSVTILAAASSNSVATTTPTAGVSATVTLTDTVISATTGTPAGTVNFYDGGVSGTLLATRTLGGNGVATLAITTLSLGTHTITAVYSGSANFTASNSSNSVTVVIANPDLSVVLSDTSLTVQQGSVGQLGITFNTVGGFSGTIVPSCSGLPANATCTFTPATFTPSAGVTSQSGVVVITAAGQTNTSTNQPTPWHRTPGLPAFAGIAGAGLLLLRRKLRGVAITSLTCFALFVALAACAGCGSTSPNALARVVTPTGTSSVMVTVTSGTTTRTATIALTVTPSR